jgi:hypothetical protein
MLKRRCEQLGLGYNLPVVLSLEIEELAYGT